MLGFAQRLQERPQAAALEPLDDARRAARQRVVIGGVPDVDAAAMGLEHGVVVTCSGHLGTLCAGVAQFADPWAIGGDFAHQAVGRLVEGVGHLDGQAAAWGQACGQRWQQGCVVGQPLQHGVGEDDVEGGAVVPVGDVDGVERDMRQPFAGRFDHVG
ncbi:hypothetical protein D3C73_1301840 [compost metagenome]